MGGRIFEEEAAAASEVQFLHFSLNLAIYGADENTISAIYTISMKLSKNLNHKCYKKI